jgi:5-methyltetrahydrofolate--homocysteine methyltransferase
MSLLLDGAMGTALRDAGLPAGILPEAWLLERPQAVARVHADHAAAGARILLTCTFNLAGPRLAAHGLGEKVEELAAAAVRLARRAAPGARVAGAVGPTALVAPGHRNRPGAAELQAWYHRPFRALAAAGADLLWSESHWDLDEARVALSAARAAGLPAVATFAPAAASGRDLALPGGPGVAEALAALVADGAAAVGVNCLTPGAPLEPFARRVAPGLGAPLVLKPSPGLPGRTLSPADFAAWLAPAARAAGAWAGGCCGATAAHLAALAEALGRTNGPTPSP